MKEDLVIMGVLAAAVLGVMWAAKNAVSSGLSAAGDAITAATPYFNPADDRNLAYQAASAGLGPNQSVGTWLYDKIHGE